MLASIATLASAALLAPAVLAQDVVEDQYTVWSSVVLTRTGERTPEILGETPTTLTSVGANQAYAAGAFFRNRYILGQIAENRNNSNGAGNAGAPLNGLNRDVYNNMQTTVLSLFQQWNAATAQAFLQGLYPPFEIGSNSTAGGQLDLSSVLADGTPVNSPLGGYQYPQVRTAGPRDPSFIYLSGNLNCPANARASNTYNVTAEFNETYTDSKGIYTAIGSELLRDILPVENWGYDQAYAIYDYLSYQNAHNSTAAAALADRRDIATNTTFLDQMRWLADKQQYAALGNETQINSVTMRPGFPGGTQGSISTIAGNMLAAQVLASLSDGIRFRGSAYKLNLFFTDYHPFLSFFSLMGLPERNRNFGGIPNFGSSMAFELFSKTNESSPTFPNDVDELFVRWMFRNGTAEGDTFQSFPILGNGPDGTDMSWREFRSQMSNIMIAQIGNWCTLCDADTIFCTAFDQDEMNDAVRDWLRSHGGPRNRSGGLSPVVSGVIGAIVTLVLAALIFALVMLLGGIRFRRTKTQRRSDLGGFKGGQKMRSDQDLTLPKGGAVVGASVEQTGPGHERVGSWELKQAEAGRLGVPSGGNSLRPSMEEARRSPDPFADPHSIKPTLPHERV